MGGLSLKRRAFVDEYFKANMNASEAARRLGYKQPYSQGSRLLRNVEIQGAIQARLAEIKMGADEVLWRLGEQARAEHTAYIRPDGTVDLGKLIEDGKAHLIKGTKWDRKGNLVVEFHDAHAALVDIGKRHGLFRDTLRIEGDVQLQIVEQIVDAEAIDTDGAVAPGTG